ncbi:MAG TPA: hypothetical protein VF593_12450 [Chthoniobacteraceae bacterium]
MVEEFFRNLTVALIQPAEDARGKNPLTLLPIFITQRTRNE